VNRTPATQTSYLPLHHHEPFPLATYRFDIHKKSTRIMGSSTYKILGTRKLSLHNCKRGSCDSSVVAQTQTPCRLTAPTVDDVSHIARI
ncbi:MAG: hypothetical protein FWH20_07360, partial [Oscillospiraceae bacterium]|nr:hypothetical protein [Oscillospiraceae bacterium]